MVRPWNAQNTLPDISQLIEQLEHHYLTPDGSYLSKSTYSELHLVTPFISVTELLKKILILDTIFGLIV
ncbi:hypothetical protein MA16_Dca018096 [Dendrobium catenatum]|uniref:Uncharacterized protein n=1 Tax=Dendrobium catenatum TaxID=906689 RepID=A0A2I0XI33_9ASPA|nr:hypothetical protein MA16_Dca018096 [Dendrobium catenatum]